jgi:hypothetical protein
MLGIVMDQRITAKEVVQGQLDAYNAHDLERFVAWYAESVLVYQAGKVEPLLQGRAALAAHYASKRFNLPNLHAELLNRMVIGNKVIDHERVVGVGEHPIEVAAAYEVINESIKRVWFFNPS